MFLFIPLSLKGGRETGGLEFLDSLARLELGDSWLAKGWILGQGHIEVRNVLDLFKIILHRIISAV